MSQGAGSYDVIVIGLGAMGSSADRHFVVGAHPGHPQVSVACGFSGHGFKFTPVIGEILADLATDGSTAHPIALFDPLRQVTRLSRGARKYDLGWCPQRVAPRTSVGDNGSMPQRPRVAVR